MNILLIIIILADPAISIGVKSGDVITTEDKAIKIKAGTFIPDPHDKILAKKIEGKNSEIKILKTKLLQCIKQLVKSHVFHLLLQLLFKLK